MKPKYKKGFKIKNTLNGIPEELLEFSELATKKLNTVNSVKTHECTESNCETEQVFLDRNIILQSIPDIPGIDKTKFQYDPERDTGYFGKISSDKFVDYKELSELLNFQAGELMEEDRGWLVFYFKGEILYIPQHPVRYNVSWDIITQAGLVYGKDITIDDNVYTISLMTGGRSDPLDDVKYLNADAEREQELDIGHGSMWNELMYRVHRDIPGVTDKHKVGLYGLQYGENWDNLTDEELNINCYKCPTGTATWTQETSAAGTPSRVSRGHARLAALNRDTSTNAYVAYGWRPVLTLKT